MITILNRRELFSTFDMKKQGDARQILSQYKIDFLVKVKIGRYNGREFESGI